MTSYDPRSEASSAALGPLGAMLRRRDPARYFAVLFAPAPKRAALVTLHAFAAEVARAPAVTREPTIALMRLMWWREVIGGAARAHEVAAPLGEALAAGLLDRDDLLAVVAAWERTVEAGIPDRAAWRAWAEGSAGGIAVAAGRLLGAPAPEALRPLGAVEGVARLLTIPAAWVGVGRGPGGSLVPEDALAARGRTVSEVLANGSDMAALRAGLAADALSWQPAARSRPGRGALPAVLAVVPARRALRCWARGRTAGAFGLGGQLAMLAAWGAGRV